MQKLIVISYLLTIAVSRSIADDPKKIENDRVIVVYYFCNTFRCPSCNSIESLTKAAVLGGEAINQKTQKKLKVNAPYPNLVKSRKIKFITINVDKKENEKYLIDFKTTAKLPVIVEMQGKKVLRYKIMNRVWKLLADNAAFVKYVQDELKEYAEPARK